MKRAALIAAAVAVLLAVAVWLASEPVLRRMVVKEARERGVELQFAKASYSAESIQLEDCVITLVGVAGVNAHVDHLTIQLEDWEPQAVDARGMRVALDGSSVETARALRAWGERHAPPRITAALDQVVWQRDGIEWLRLERGTLDTTDRLAVDAQDLAVFDRAVGPLQAHIANDVMHVSLGLGGDIAAAPAMLVVALDSQPLEADLALKHTPLSELARPLGVVLPANLSASGNARLRFVDGFERGAIRGRAQASLEGYQPPVPIELKKLAFGKTTEIETLFETSDDRELVRFSSTRIKHGVMGLEGDGTIERKEGRAVLHAALAGRLLCRDVAASAASAHAEGPLATWLSDLGRATLSGSVGIRVVIDADFARLDQARIVPTVGVGCGLRLP